MGQHTMVDVLLRRAFAAAIGIKFKTPEEVFG
jgi:hypothetical protein